MRTWQRLTSTACVAVAAGLLLPVAPAGATTHVATTSDLMVSGSSFVGPRTSVWKSSASAKVRRKATTGSAARKVTTAPTSPAPTAPTTGTTLGLGDTPSSVFTRSGGRPFAVSSAWNSPVPASPVLDAKSSAVVTYLATGRAPGVADLYEYGVPIWDADASTPRFTVDCVKPWGTCGLEREPVPVPAEAFATDVDDDGAMVVIDWSTRRAYEFYEGMRTTTGWQAGWGGVVNIDGDGTDGAATGSNVSRLAGVVRAREIAAGRIDHALVFSTNNACTAIYRYPARKTDGRSTRTDCIPEGARIQLDPSIDVDAIPGITPGEKAVAKALQTYGAYAIDNGGANMAFIFEVPSGEADPYKAAGLTSDYFGMNRIPWAKLKVLRQWDGR